MVAQLLQQAGYVQDAASGVWRDKADAPTPFAYSDGAIEQYIYEQLASVDDLSTGSAELLLKIKDWPTLYHFSPQRADLLRPLAHKLKGDILEIGAGCGAITRYLGEVGGSVVAIEGAQHRAAIARRRCRNQDNVEILCGNAMDVALPAKFDVVTLIGVLEYSKKFVGGADPVDAMLQRCRAFLRPGGLLIVAIENKLGLKYFAGAYEDHEGKAFYGVHGSYGAKESVTFGRAELGQKVEQAGFLGRRFYYPFPDYKLPHTVLTHEGATSQAPAVMNLTATFAADDQAAPYRRTFSEQAAWPQLMRNGLLAELANSFLLVARQAPFNGEDDVLADNHDLAYVYATTRPRQFHRETVLRHKDGAYPVVRRRLYPALTARRGGLTQHLHNEASVTGTSLLSELTQVVNRPGWSVAHVARWAQPWSQYVHKVHAAEGDYANEMPQLPGHYIDLSPHNLWRQAQDGALRPVDLEWDLGQGIPAHYVMFRGLMHALTSCKSVAPPAQGTPLHIGSMVQQVLAQLDWQLSEEECISLARLEATVFGGTPEAYWNSHVTPRV